MDYYNCMLNIIGAELDFLDSSSRHEDLYKKGFVDKNDYLKALEAEEAKRDSTVEKIRNHIEEKAKEEEVNHE